MVKIQGKRKINKNNMLLKYDKNKDGIISLEEYLSKEISLGPKAKKTTIDYNYQDYDNIFNYFMIVFSKKSKFKIVCIPNLTLHYKDFKTRAALAYDIENDILYHGFEDKTKEDIIKCSKKSNIRFIYFTFIIYSDEKASISHANVIIIDLHKKTYERFEPHGKQSEEEGKIVNKLFRNRVKRVFGLEDFTYISPANISPIIGIQSIADSYCGMCITISMMYLHMRILNPDIPQKKLVKFLINRDKNKLKEMILKYAKHVEESLKKNKITVLNLFDKL